jgi:hypothetical protein
VQAALCKHHYASSTVQSLRHLGARAARAGGWPVAAAAGAKRRSEKGLSLAKKTTVGLCIPVGSQLQRAERLAQLLGQPDVFLTLQRGLPPGKCLACTPGCARGRADGYIMHGHYSIVCAIIDMYII